MLSGTTAAPFNQKLKNQGEIASIIDPATKKIQNIFFKLRAEFLI
jgi:hypothetical protein